MDKTAEAVRNRELAHFLRNRRERITPAEAGLPQAGRRRTPGLRRGEVAQLAGVSLEWYTFLEQGRPIQASAEVLESLAIALRMDAAERRHMFLLAHKQPPPEKPAAQSEVGSGVRLLLDELAASPACAMDARMNIVAWNAAMRVLYGDLDRTTETERNLLWHTFLSADFRRLKGDEWDEHARRTVAQFRAEMARHPGDPWWSGHVAAVSEASAEFRDLWERHDVLDYSNARKIMHHPVAGPLAFEYVAFQPLDAPDLQVGIHVPLDEETKRKIRKLLAL
ncbi:helix-turn-helix domain-containing protein [Paenibacillus sp. MWE-103]|uniref:Helix-turn-helix domain-containing protein n=1 Tax=Paenibacillus artemisiicola TaxID=1172618 RepID=A0ABS3WD76_9BACL|nr:helix-turn-helix transcriptional regulator [Paenibacillus artemisiicola]MBO7746256.1 helix-turn-helix domain-containing protein [Paenibacillus artemisiicola]